MAVRQLSFDTVISAGTRGCLESFCDYIQTRRNELLGDTTIIIETNAVEKMIDLMNRRGFPNLNMKTATSFYRLLYSDKFTRDDMFKGIITWTNASLTYSVSDLRDHIDSSIGLSAAVKLSDHTYYTTLHAAVKKYGFRKCTELERENVNSILANNKIYKKKPQDNEVIYKTQCGICWICGTPIYQFWVDDDRGVRTELNACGEDEHTLTPGYGTLVGTLLFSPTELTQCISNAIGSEESLLRRGLRPSHAFCNRAKGELKFINSPTATKSGEYSVNTTNINQFMENMKTGGKKLSYEYQFLDPDTNFLKHTKETVMKYMTELCTLANSVVNLEGKTGGVTRYNTAFLKAIFITCLTAVKVYPKELGTAWTTGQKKGGNNKLITGGEITEDDRPLNTYMDENGITDAFLTSLVISDVCLNLNDQIPAVDEMEQSQVFLKTNDRGKSAKKAITSEEGREHRATAVRDRRKSSRSFDIWNWRLKQYNRVNQEGGTRHNQKTQRRSFHKKHNKTLKKNKRPPTKTQRRRRN
jgi:hypothetical protein